MAEQEGTGKHPHKSSEEPWPHGKESSEGESERREASGESRPESGGEDRDLKEREYRDEQGQVHHHTHTYEEQHGSESRSEQRKAS